MRRLEGKTVLVAGGGGIGGGLARRYAQEGASVVLGDIDVHAAAQTVEEIVAAGGTALAARLDGTDQRSITEAVALACSTYGGLDGLHANFASFVDQDQDTGILELPLEAFDETLRVNLRGYYLCTRIALPAILQRGGGSIIYTSSPAASKGEPTRVAYAVSKAGGQALMRHVAARYGSRGVRANSVSPGSVLHARHEGELTPATKEWLYSLALIKSRLGRPEDIAAMCALLMSDEGSYITGQVISVDGGVTMRL
ncbi:MAG TPA: SDR family oxidoreductase [Steroidobacteraceae bacterium]|nr:SDR family oxidoreductase [Steroidobacteraceae bacterium]